MTHSVDRPEWRLRRTVTTKDVDGKTTPIHTGLRPSDAGWDACLQVDEGAIVTLELEEGGHLLANIRQTLADRYDRSRDQ